MTGPQRTGLPTREQMMQLALAAMEEARADLSEARDWLNSDWQPGGSSLTDDQAAARTATRGAISSCKRDIDGATEALRRAIAGDTR